MCNLPAKQRLTTVYVVTSRVYSLMLNAGGFRP